MVDPTDFEGHFFAVKSGGLCLAAANGDLGDCVARAGRCGFGFAEAPDLKSVASGDGDPFETVAHLMRTRVV